MTSTIHHDPPSQTNGVEHFSSFTDPGKNACHIHVTPFESLLHDLLNRLAGINAATTLINHLIAPKSLDDKEQLLELLARIEVCVTQIQRMLMTLQDQQDSVPYATRQPEDATDLVKLIQRSVAEFQHVAYPQDIHFQTTLATLVGRWNPLHIERIVNNLLENAIKYSVKPSAIGVTLSSATEMGSTWAVLTVSDHGIGIPLIDQPHIFDDGYRASNVTNAVNGNGHGLAICQRLAASYGGSLSVSSIEGDGSTFTLRLPTAMTLFH